MNRAGKIQLFDQFDTEQDALKRLEHLRSSGEDSQYQVVRQEWPIPDRTLPTDRQIRALWDFMHHVLVLIRSMSWDEKSQQIAELTDILEIMPLNIDSAERWDWNYFESALRKFAEKHGEGMRLARLLHEIHCNP
jgi:hypothetical protein